MSKKVETIRPYGETEIDAHAAKVGGRRNLREVEIESEDCVFAYLVKKPSRAVMQAVAAAEEKKNLDQVQKLLLGCVLEGDKDAYEYDGGIYMKLLEEIGGLVTEAKSSIKKL